MALDIQHARRGIRYGLRQCSCRGRFYILQIRRSQYFKIKGFKQSGFCLSGVQSSLKGFSYAYFDACCLHRQLGFADGHFAEVENAGGQYRIGFALQHAVN